MWVSVRERVCGSDSVSTGRIAVLSPVLVVRVFLELDVGHVK